MVWSRTWIGTSSPGPLGLTPSLFSLLVSQPALYILSEACGLGRCPTIFPVFLSLGLSRSTSVAKQTTKNDWILLLKAKSLIQSSISAKLFPIVLT